MMLGSHVELLPPPPLPVFLDLRRGGARATERPQFAAERAAGEAARRNGGAALDAEPGEDRRRLRLLPAPRTDAAEAPPFGGTSLPFLAQHIAQERLSGGLTIEPWREAVRAYGGAPSTDPLVDLAA